jgi:hypothetical protein
VLKCGNVSSNLGAGIRSVVYFVEIYLDRLWQLSQCSVWLQTPLPGFDPQQRLFSSSLSVSRPALRPTQPTIQWYWGSCPGGKARTRRDADYSPHLIPRLRMSRNCTPLPLDVWMAVAWQLLRDRWDCIKYQTFYLFTEAFIIISDWLVWRQNMCVLRL